MQHTRSASFVWLAVGAVFGLAVSFFWPQESVEATTDRDAGGKFAIFTCPVQELSAQPDAVFVLDFSTGRLTGAAMNPQSGTFTQFYQRNVAADFNLSPEMAAKYVVTTGQLNLSSRGGGAIPAKNGIFIAELTSGLVNCYSFPYQTNGSGISPIVAQAQFPFRQAMNP